MTNFMEPNPANSQPLQADQADRYDALRIGLDAAVRAIGTAQSIVVTSHVNPDGDALGCVLAVTHLLRALGKDVTPLMADGVPDIYRWLPGADDVQTQTARDDFELVIVCDAGQYRACRQVGTPDCRGRARRG